MESVSTPPDTHSIYNEYNVCLCNALMRVDLAMDLYNYIILGRDKNKTIQNRINE